MGKNIYINVCESVEIDVDVSIPVSKILSQLDRNDVLYIANKFGIRSGLNSDKHDLRRYLCDYFGLSYHTEKKELLILLNEKL